MMKRKKAFDANIALATEVNARRLDHGTPLTLPPLEFMEIQVLVEYYFEGGYLGDPGVSYLIKTDKGSLLFDVGYGPQTSTLEHNAKKRGVVWKEIDGLAISHFHHDHMGGLKAVRKKEVMLPKSSVFSDSTPCFLPQKASVHGLSPRIVEEPQLLVAGIGTTGPLARSLFFLGYIEEQVIIANLKDRGVVVITGCGHPGIDLILKMVSKLTDLPVYALVGGLHFPLTKSRVVWADIQLQMLMGTGKPPWQKITEKELEETIELLNRAGVSNVLLSAHDSCDEAVHKMDAKLEAKCQILKAGATYTL